MAMNKGTAHKSAKMLKRGGKRKTTMGKTTTRGASVRKQQRKK